MHDCETHSQEPDEIITSSQNVKQSLLEMRMRLLLHWPHRRGIPFKEKRWFTGVRID